MKSRSHKFWGFIGCSLLLLTVPCVLMWNAWREEKRDQTLIVAIRHNDTQTAIALLKQGADANVHTASKTYSFRQAVWDHLFGRCYSTNTNSLTALLVLFSDDEDTEGDFQAHPSRQEPIELARALIDHGADIRAVDEYGASVIVYAAVYGRNNEGNNLQCVKLLLDAGADVNAETRNRSSLLLCAIKGNDVRMAQLLLSRGAKCQIDGEEIPALLAAKHYDNPPEMLALLKRYGFKSCRSRRGRN